MSKRRTAFGHHTVVVGVPVYNEQTYIQRTLESLAAQDSADFLAAISDNASTDATGDICRTFAQRDRRFHYVRQPFNIGAVDNFNFLLDHTRSPYFMWLGAHDLIAPAFLSRHIAAFDAHPHVSLSYAHTQWIDEMGRPLKVTHPGGLQAIAGSPADRYIRSVELIGECTPVNSLLRREALGRWPQAKVAASDHILLSRLLFWGPFHCVPEPLYLRRHFAARERDYMETMTGAAGRRRDHRETIAAYLADFDQLHAGAAPLLHRFRLKSALLRRFDPKNAGARGLLRRIRHFGRAA